MILLFLCTVLLLLEGVCLQLVAELLRPVILSQRTLESAFYGAQF